MDEVTKRSKARGAPFPTTFKMTTFIVGGLPPDLIFLNQAHSDYPSYNSRRYEFNLLRHVTVRPVKRDEKLNPTGDYLGIDEIESRGLLIHDPVTLYLVRLCLASANKGVQACFLYNIGYRLLISGNRTSSLQVLKILEDLDKNLSTLLSSRLNKYYQVESLRKIPQG